MHVMEKVFGTAYQVAEEAVETARRRRDQVEFQFNGVTVVAHPLSRVDDVADIAMLKLRIKQLERT